MPTVHKDTSRSGRPQTMQFGDIYVSIITFKVPIIIMLIIDMNNKEIFKYVMTTF